MRDAGEPRSLASVRLFQARRAWLLALLVCACGKLAGFEDFKADDTGAGGQANNGGSHASGAGGGSATGGSARGGSLNLGAGEAGVAGSSAGSAAGGRTGAGGREPASGGVTQGGSPSAQGGVVSTQAGGAQGGAAGGKPPTPQAGAAGEPSLPAPQDWTSSLDAVYRFEGFGGAIGRDSSGNDRDLVPVGLPVHVEDAAEGEWAAHVSNEGASPSHFTSDDWLFSSTSFTVGGWFRTGSGGGGVLLHRGGPRDEDAGFMLEISVEYRGVRCSVTDAKKNTADSTRNDLTDFAAWTHVVCRYNDDTKRMQLYVNGIPQQPEDTLTNGIGETNKPFTLGDFEGDMDEVFFTPKLLDNFQIARIWGCGIDGTKCSCSSTNENVYTTCGRYAGNCAVAPFSPCAAEPPGW